MVVLKLYDARGRELRTLVNQEQSTGTHRVEPDARALSSGVYVYRLEAGSMIQQRKMVLRR